MKSIVAMIKTFYIESVKNLYKLKDELKVTKNKIRTVVKYKKEIFTLLATLTFVIGFIGYLNSADSTGLEILNNTVGLFVFAWAGDDNWILDIAKFLTLFTMFFGAITLYLSKSADKYEVERIQENPYTLLIGLGEQNSAFLNQLKQDDTFALVIEPDTQNPQIEYFKERGIGVINSKAEDVVKELNLQTVTNTIISTGDDRQNIEIAIKLMDAINKIDDIDRHKKIFVRIEDRDIGLLFKQNIIRTVEGVDVIVYSLYENMVKSLFMEHSILGLQPEIIKSNKAYNIILVGNSKLAVEIIYHLVILANLPEENILNLYLIDKEAKKFFSHIKKIFTAIEKIPHVNIEPLDIDSDSLEFYNHKVWNKKNLTNIIIATDDEKKNLNIAINLQDTTYVKQTAKDSFKTKVLVAIYNDLGLAKEIDTNKKLFKNFYTFADITKASSAENLIDEKQDLIAKLIHNGYTGADATNTQSLDKKWLNTDSMNQHKRASNRTQALHIDTKLLVLGLKRVASTKNLKELLKHNSLIFDKKIPKKERDENFPKEFNTLLSKLARSEHNRWNAFHYLNGWSYNKVKNEPAKEHDCLLPFSKFDTTYLQGTYKWDMQAVLNIPIYLTHAGYELVEA
jgi:hypothetical protein